MKLQYFHFETPQKVALWVDGVEHDRIALGYWQEVEEGPGGNTFYNLSRGEANATGWTTYMTEVQS